MGQIAASVYINRSQQDVFDFMSNPANLPAWKSAFASAEWTSRESPRIGSTYRVSAKVLGSKKEGLFEIVRWDRPNCYAYQMNARLFPIERIETTFTFQPMNNDTKVTFESRFALVSALAFAESFFARMGLKQDGEYLAIAKRLLEAV